MTTNPIFSTYAISSLRQTVVLFSSAAGVRYVREPAQ